MKINRNSLQARVRNLSTQKGVPSNAILQFAFLEKSKKLYDTTTIYKER